MVQKTIFISYNSSDETWAKFLVDELSQMGHRPLAMFKGDFGGDYRQQIDEAIRDSDDFIFILSPDFEKSQQCLTEWNQAFNKQIKINQTPGGKNVLHPIKIHPDPVEKSSIDSVSYCDLSIYAPDSEDTKTLLQEWFGTWLNLGGDYGGDKHPHPEKTKHNLERLTPNFTGREEIIDTLHKEFFSGIHGKRIQVLTGLGGVGKSWVALAYAHRNLELYNLVWFFHAEEKSVLRQELITFANLFRSKSAQSESYDQAIYDVRKYLENHDRWLLIFDNAVSPGDLKPLLPAIIKGHILVTSRNTDWGSMACIMPVTSFSAKESAGFLRRRLNRDNEQACFEQLGTELDNIPLVLEFAASYMDKTSRRCEEYRTILKKGQGHKSLSELQTIWKPSLEIIGQESKGSIDLLENLTLFSPDNIPEDVLCSVLMKAPSVDEDLIPSDEYLDALSLLLQYSFVSRDMSSQALIMHRVVQDTVRMSMDAEKRKNLAATAVENISRIFPIKSNDPETITTDMWAACNRILPHAIHAAKIADDLKAAPVATLHIYAQIASFLRELDNLKEAAEFARKSVSIASGVKGSLDYAIALETLARVLRDLGRNTEARDLMLEAIQVEENLNSVSRINPLSETDRHHISICYDGYGRILSNLGRTDEALTFYKKALTLDLQFYGEKDARIAIRKNNIAVTYGTLGKDDIEIQYLKEALAIEEECYKGNHPYIAIRLGSLAILYEYFSKRSKNPDDCLDRALAYWERAFKIDSEFYGPAHQTPLSRMFGLAGNYTLRNKYEKALEWNNRALEISQKEDPDGYSCGMSHLNRGHTLLAMKNYSSAEEDYEKSLAIIIRNRGEGSSDHSTILKSISHLEFERANYPAAVDFLQKALNIDEALKFQPDRNSMIHFLNLGYYHILANNPKNAESCYNQALQLSKTVCEKNSPDRSMVLKNLAAFEGNEKQFGDAARHLSEALEIDKANNQAHGIDYCISLANLGIYYVQSKDNMKAIPCFEQALPMIEKESGINNENYLVVLVQLINAKIAAKDIQDIPELIKKYESIRAALVKDEPG
ncbi:MAG: tetratricopeptide repeat protein [Methanoregula sp.]